MFIRLNWFRNDANITGTKDPRFKVEIIREEKLKAVLWIKNTTVKDSGEYTCVAESSAQTTVNQTVIATVDGKNSRVCQPQCPICAIKGLGRPISSKFEPRWQFKFCLRFENKEIC